MVLNDFASNKLIFPHGHLYFWQYKDTLIIAHVEHIILHHIVTPFIPNLIVVQKTTNSHRKTVNNRGKLFLRRRRVFPHCITDFHEILNKASLDCHGVWTNLVIFYCIYIVLNTTLVLTVMFTLLESFRIRWKIQPTYT